MRDPNAPLPERDQKYGRVSLRPLFAKVSTWLLGGGAKTPYAGHVPPRPIPAPAPDVGIPTSTHKTNADQTVAVATDVYFNPDMSTCPRGLKVQLVGEGGVAAYGTYNGDPFWIEWAPVPKRRKAA